MHAEFDCAAEVTTDVVCYSHARHPLVIDGVDTMTDTARDAAAVIRFLASAETVTNTCHGMYWATDIPSRCRRSEDWQAARRRTVACPEALAECRAANRAFAVKVQDRVVRLLS